MAPALERLLDDLAACVRTAPSGARTLDHICVVLPTAQAGRRLRLALAKRYGAIVPPAVCLPDQLLVDPADPTIATRTDEIAAFATVTGQGVAIAAELSDLRHILLEKALSFADVAERLAAKADDLPEGLFAETGRWQKLAEIEKAYEAELAKRGKRDRTRVATERDPYHPAVKDPLAGAAHRCDPSPARRFDAVLRYDLPESWGAPSAFATRRQIFPAATPASEAAAIADYFAAVKPSEAWPALVCVDPELFPALKSAFEARGLKLHNPAATPLAASSLGHLVRQIAELLRTPSYSVFSAFVRSGDVRRWLCRELRFSEDDFVGALTDLDNRQQELLPEVIDDIAPKTEKKLRAIFEFVKVQLRKKGIREMLESIFRDLKLDPKDEASREFTAAADVVNRLLDACYADGVPERLRNDLFAFSLDEATYSLEPDADTVILADGWMDLPFVDADEIVIAGLGEHCVPESVVGHPYLPDRLRTFLGLTDNAHRTIRDKAVFVLAVGSRAENAVRLSFHVIDEKGDALKPSRLLFLTDDDRDLVARVNEYYGVSAGTEALAAADLPPQWKLALPVPPTFETLTKISPTRLDTYLRCPFTYYLRRKDILGDKRLDDRAEELASWEYGNLAHEALEKFGLSALKTSDDAAAIAEFLEADVDRQLVARFGTAIPAIVSLQGESVKGRLRAFATAQAARRKEGWEILSVEEKLEVAYGHTRLYGKCDRVDFHPATGRWCVIDYKTWDSLDTAQAYDDRKREWHSLQLPIYCAMLDACETGVLADAHGEAISSCYAILGASESQVGFTEPMSWGYVSEAEKKARELIARIEKGIFWPPGPGMEWRYDCDDWLAHDPEKSVNEDWIADQNRRIEEAAAEAEAAE